MTKESARFLIKDAIISVGRCEERKPQNMETQEKHCMWGVETTKYTKYTKRRYAQNCQRGRKPQNTQNTQKKDSMWGESTENTDHTKKHCMWGFTVQMTFPAAVGWLIHAGRGVTGAA